MAQTRRARSSKSALTPPKSQHAPLQPTSPEPAPVGALDVTGAREVFLRAQSSLAAHAPSEALRKRFEAQIDADDAIADGGRIASDVVLYDAMTDLPLVLAAVIGGEVPGFGPREAHYTVSLALTLEASWRAFQDQQVARAGVSTTKSLTLEAAREERATLHELLESAVAPGSSEAAALAKAAGFGGKVIRSVAQGLDALVKVARDQLSAAAHDASLAELLADKGLTAARVDAAAAYSTQLSKAATGHAEARSGVDAGQAALDELDGRLRDELVRLRRAVQQTQRRGVKVPEVKLANVRRLYRTPRKSPVTPPPAPPA
jgi:hypothetical protein